ELVDGVFLAAGHRQVEQVDQGVAGLVRDHEADVGPDVALRELVGGDVGQVQRAATGGGEVLALRVQGVQHLVAQHHFALAGQVIGVGLAAGGSDVGDRGRPQQQAVEQIGSAS